MSTTQGTLAAQLLNLGPAITEADAIVTLSDVYATFAADATAGAASISTPGVALGKIAMQAALVGMSSPGAGSASLTSGVQAFWAGVASGLAASFSGAVAVTPPPHVGLQALLDTIFASNVASASSLADATNAIATVLHDQVIIGGTVTFPGPVVSPIT